MKRMTGEPWSLFLAVCLAACQVFVGCASKDSDSRSDDTSGPNYRFARVQFKAQEDPMEEEEELEPEEMYERGPALDEGKMGKEDSARATGQFLMKNTGDPALAKSRAMDQARNAGVLGSLPSSAGAYSSLTGTADFSAGLSGAKSGSAIGTGNYGTIGHGSSAGAPAPSKNRVRRAPRRQPQVAPESSTEGYKHYGANPMVATAEDRLSTFAVDVDTASYAIARRKINEGRYVPQSAVRVEEFVNYFRYNYAGPTSGEAPFAVHMDAAPSPFMAERHVLRVGVQAKKLSLRERKQANLVFLVDVSGSMRSPDKLGLAKRALRILTHNLRDGDKVSMVTYAGRTSVALAPTGLDDKGKILSAIEDLNAGGSTAMSSGIELAYELAARNLGPKVESRVIVLSDGDANVGATSHEQILAKIKGHVKEGVTLSTVGFGMGNYQDELMEQLANKGNGNYYYIDGISQARRVFQEQLGGTLEVVAKDVKIQVEFDPDRVTHYRLIGYENRKVADRDFRNDRVDAGEIGAGHTVTAMYEVALAEGASGPPAVVRIRAKKPRGTKAREWAYRFDMRAMHSQFDQASADFRFATAAMGAAEIMRGSEHASAWRITQVIELARAAVGDHADRQEFVELMSKLPRAKAERNANRSGVRMALTR